MDKPTVPEFDGVSLTPVFHTDIEYTIPKTNDTKPIKNPKNFIS